MHIHNVEVSNLCRGTVSGKNSADVFLSLADEDTGQMHHVHFKCRVRSAPEAGSPQVVADLLAEAERQLGWMPEYRLTCKRPTLPLHAA